MSPAAAVIIALFLGIIFGAVFAEDLRRAFERMMGD
jgi:hypothetical protein